MESEFGASLRFGILGPLEVWRDGREVRLGGERQRALLALLLVRANELVTAEALVDELSGTRRSDSALNALRVAVSRLRQVLGGDGPEGVLATGPGGYVLRVDPEQVDAARFERLLNEARGELAAGRPEHGARRLREALGLWRGDSMADVRMVEGLQPEIRRLEGLRLSAVMERIDVELSLGGGAELVGELEALVVAEPLQERLRGQLMRAMYSAGRQADALAVYRQTSELLRDELGLEPSTSLQELESAIFRQDPALSRVAVLADVIARLPSPAGPMFGRERETEAIARVLRRPEVRLVTLVGPGGVGKTRLALAVASALERHFRDGGCWVELVGVARAEDVAFTLAQALGVTVLGGEELEAALWRVLSGKQLLLVVDNFEHVLDAAALVGRLLSRCREVTVLATSREALELTAEHRVVVDPLALPESPERATVAEVESAGATAMFIASVRRHDSRFVLSLDTAAAVARLCARLDGLPLAIELAAARTRLLGVEELAARLADDLAGLGTGARDAPARQRTLHATIEWSYGLLDEAQRLAFQRFAVFVGGATLDAAQDVSGATLQTIEALVDKSLLTRQVTHGTSRLMMLETIREYALDRFAQDVEQQGVRRRHLVHYLERLGEANTLWGPHEHEALAVLDPEIGNLRAALQWSIDHAPELAVQLAGRLGEYWGLRQDPDAVPSVDAALAAGDRVAAVEDRALARLARSWLLGQWGRFAEQADTARAALALYRDLGDEVGIAASFRVLAGSAMRLGETVERREYAEQACLHARASGDDAALGVALATLAWALPGAERLPVLEQAGELLQRVGNYRELTVAYMNAAYSALEEDRPADALELLEVAERAADQLPDSGTQGLVCGNIGLAHLFLGDLARARDGFVREIVLCGQMASRFGVEEGLAGLAAIAAKEGLGEHAARLLGAALAHGRWDPGDRIILDRLESKWLAPARARHGVDAWRQAEQAGAAMSYEEAIAYVLRDSQGEQVSQTRPDAADGASTRLR